MISRNEFYVGVEKIENKYMLLLLHEIEIVVTVLIFFLKRKS